MFSKSKTKINVLLKESWSSLSDGTNVRWLKIFHLYKGFWRRSTHESLFVKGSAQVVEPPQITYKGTKFKYSKKGDVIRSIIIRTYKPTKNKTGFTVLTNTNDSLTIKKKQTLKSKYVKGIVFANALKRRKFLVLFSKIF
jgi:ribosomal protein L14